MRTLPAWIGVACGMLIVRWAPARARAAGTGIIYVASNSGVQMIDSGGRAAFPSAIPVAAGGSGNHLVVALAVVGSSVTVSSVTYDQLVMTRRVSRTAGSSCRVELWELPLVAPDGRSHDVVVRASTGGVMMTMNSAHYRGVRTRVSPAVIGFATGNASPAAVTAASGAGQFTVGAACNRGAGSRVGTPIAPSDGFVGGSSVDPLSMSVLWAESGVMASQTVSWTVTGASQGWVAVSATLAGDPPVVDAGADATDALPDVRVDDTASDPPAATDGRPDQASDQRALDDGAGISTDVLSLDQGPPGEDGAPGAASAPPEVGAMPGDEVRAASVIDLRVGCACSAAAGSPPGGAAIALAVALLWFIRLRRR
jgi:MYXO-CTERM domain-containing protein